MAVNGTAATITIVGLASSEALTLTAFGAIKAGVAGVCALPPPVPDAAAVIAHATDGEGLQRTLVAQRGRHGFVLHLLGRNHRPAPTPLDQGAVVQAHPRPRCPCGVD